MTFSRLRVRTAWFGICLASISVASQSLAVDVLWQGPDLGNWTIVANWNNPNTGGLPLRDFDEVAVFNNNVTAVVNSSITGSAGPAGLTFGVLAAETGGLTIQSGGTLTSEPGFGVFGAADVGVAGKGFLTVLGGGNLTTRSLTTGGSTAGGTQSELTLGDATASTATYTVIGNSSLNRTTRIVGPNVNFTTQGALNLGTAGTLIPEIRHATNHSAIKATGVASIGGTLRPTFSGVTPALGNTWNLVDADVIGGGFATIDASLAPALPAGQSYLTRRIAGGTNGQLLQLVVEQVLTLQVHRNTGAVTIRNTGAAVPAASVSIDGYSVVSTHGSLGTTTTWSSLQEQLGGGWAESGATANGLSELNPSGTLALAGGATRGLGSPYTPTFPSFGVDPDDISFTYTTSSGLRTGIVEYLGTKQFNNLLLTVDPATGQAQLKNDSPHTIQLEGYSIFSPSNSLKPANGQWNSLTDQAVPGFVEAAPTAGVLSELNPTGMLTLTGGQAYNLGTPFTVGGAQTLSLEFLLAGEANNRNGQVAYGAITEPSFAADFDNDGDVDGADLGVWRGAFGSTSAGDADGDNDSDGADFLVWQRQLGSGASTAAAAAVPEPAAFGLAACGLVAAASRRRRRPGCSQVSVESRTRTRSQVMRRRGIGRGLAFAALAACLGLAPGVAQAVNIAWLSFHNPDGTASTAAAADPFLFTMAPDIGYTNALTTAGHTVTRFTVVNDIQNSTLAADLNAPGIDLVIVSRSVDSGHFQTDAETLVWNSTVAKPMIVMSAFAARGTRLGLTRNIDDNTPDTTAPVKLEAVVPNHPIFSGVALDGSNVMVNNYNLDVTAIQQVAGLNQRFFNTVMHPLNGGGQILARISDAGPTQNGLVIGLAPAGGVVQNVNADADDVLAAARMVFFSGTREHAAVTGPPAIPSTSQIAGIYDLDADGQKLFLNAVNFMAGTNILRPGDVDGDGDVDMADFDTIRTNFRTTVTNRNQGDLTGDGFVDLLDFRQWKDNDLLAGAGAGAAIPEPSSLLLALLGVAAFRRQRRAAPASHGDDARNPRWAKRRGLLGAMAALAAWSCLALAPARAANVAWVSFHAADDMPSQAAVGEGYTQAPDVGYTNLLATAGHNVTRFVTVNDVNLNTTLIDQLNAPGIDLVMISRSVDSGHYQTADEATTWNSTITKPMMILGGYTMRNSRLGFMGGETIPDTTGPVKLTTAVPAHPIFAGVALDGSNTMVNDYSTAIPVLDTVQNPNTVQRGISVNELPIDNDGAGGTLIARLQNPISPGGNLVIAEWAAGTSITKDTGAQTLSNRRLVFLTGSREQSANGTSQQSGMFDLAPDGQTMFLNAVAYIGGPGFQPGDVDNDGDVDMTDFNTIKDRFQQSATSRAEGDLNGDGFVDWSDFRQWKDNHPFPGGAAGGAVPEPAAAGLAVVALAAVTTACRRNRATR